MGAPSGHEIRATIDSTERHAEWARLEAKGWTRTRIAQYAGVNKSSVTRGIDSLLASVKSQAADELRAQSDERLRAVLERAFDELDRPHPLVRDGQRYNDITDVAAVVSLLRTVVITDASQRRLHGLDAPTKAEVRVRDDLDAEIFDLADRLARASGGAAGRSEESPAGQAQN